MSALLNTLHGDIPGLLRKWSPVLVTIDSDKPPVCGVVIDPIIEPDEVDARCLVWNERNGRDNKAAMFVCLDLTDITARAHAAWWAEKARTYADVIEVLRNAEHVFYVDAIDVICRAKAGRMMTPEQIDTLARLVLRLAGRTQ